MEIRPVKIFLALVLFFGTLPFPAKDVLGANTYIVNSEGCLENDANLGDGICATASGDCTLKAALQEAVYHPIPTIINFSQDVTNIRYLSCVKIIDLYGGDITIDARDHEVTIDANINIWSDNNKIYGLRLGGTIFVGSSSNEIQGNVIEPGEGEIGIMVTDGNNHRLINNIIEPYVVTQISNAGIYIGVRAGDTYIGNNRINNADYGIFIEDANNSTKGSITVEENELGYILINGIPYFFNGNRIGIHIGKRDNNIIKNNLLINNKEIALDISGNSNQIMNNRTYDGSRPYLYNPTGGTGIRITGNYNLCVGNTMEKNGANGIEVGGEHNLILTSSCADNGQDGIRLIGGSNNVIGSVNAGNYIYGNQGHGISFAQDTYNLSNLIQGNEIGDIYGGWSPPGKGNKGHGIFLSGTALNNTIGGNLPGFGNTIWSNDQCGVYLYGPLVANNFIQGNQIGETFTTVSGYRFSSAPGQHAIALYYGPSGNMIGLANGGNTVLASGWSGIAVIHSDGNSIRNNYIGTDPGGETWGNNYYGIIIGESASTVVENNLIAYNGRNPVEIEAGVKIEGALAQKNLLTKNRIWANDGPGILLASGANGSIDLPVITGATCDGLVTGTTCKNCRVEIFSDDDAEGRIYHGSVQDGGSGKFTFSGKVFGPKITATATDLLSNTSAFSEPWSLGLCPQLYLPLIIR